MKKSIVFAPLAGLCLITVVSVSGTTLLLDFGNDDSFRGASVPNPDPNGNYWNSVRPGLFFPELIDTENNVTTIAYGPGAHPTDSYNGPAGAVDQPGIGPEDSEYDPVALGDIGVDEAVYDYHVGVLGTESAYFEIQGLEQGTDYTLSFYGAHKYIAEPSGLTTYNVYADADRTQLLDSVDLSVGSIGDVHNTNLLATLTLQPGEDGIFYIEFGGADGVNDGYINAMSIEYEASVQPDAWAGYPMTPEGDVDTEGFVGWINVMSGDYVWSYNLSKYIYLPETSVQDGGAWTYVAK